MDARGGNRVSDVFGLLSNFTALSVNNSFNKSLFNLAGNINQLSTGLRITTPSIDVAGNALAQRLQSEFAIQQQGSINAQDLVSAGQVAQGSLGQINDILNQVGTLAAEATNPLLDTVGRGAIQTSINQLTQQITQIAGGTNFGGVPLLQGNAAGPQQAVASTISVNTNAFVGAQGQSLVNNITVNPSNVNPPTNGSSFLNEAFQFNIVQNGASAVTVNVTASGNPNVIVASVAVNFAAGPPGGLTPITIASSAPGGATFVANLNFQNLSANDIPSLVNQTAFVSTTAFQPSIVANQGLQVQIGAGVGQTIQGNFPSALPSALFQNQNIDVSSPLAAQGALVQVQQALGAVTQAQTGIGAFQNQLSAAVSNNNIMSQNILASSSRITDLNVALATTSFTSNSILAQFNAGLLSQANLIPHSLLNLFGGIR